MGTLEDVLGRIRPVDRAVADETQRLLDLKTKPRRSLGRLEDLACQIAAIRGTPCPAPLEKTLVIMGADHGVAEEGVSAFPQVVTREMLLSFARGGAAINVLARQVDARVFVVDMGVASVLPPDPQIRTHRLGAGTANFTRGPAMSRETALAAIRIGVDVAGELIAGGSTLLGIGEMGIGNTTASSAIATVLTGAPPEEVVGRGTGIDDAGLQRKLEAVRRAISVNRPDALDPVDVLAKVGGFEIAGLCGVVLGAAARSVPIVMDGFIASTAALCAVRLAPPVREHLIAAHRSVESGHGIVLAEMATRPLFDLDLRLGEGSGAALAMGLVDAALAILWEMATFEAAGVSDSGA